MYSILRELLKDHKEQIIFKCFGITHLIFLAIICGGIVAILCILKNKDEKFKKRIINLTITSAFCLYILDFFLMPFAYGEIDIEKLPFHICTISCVLCFLSRHNKFLYQYKLSFALIGLIGNLIYTIYPAGVGWYQVSVFSYRVIQTLLYHSIMVLYGILTITYDDEKIKWKNCYKELIIIVIITLWALLGNYLYNNELRMFNWFFVVQDPFSFLPLSVSRFVMPFLIIIITFLVDILIYLGYFGIKKIFKKS